MHIWSPDPASHKSLPNTCTLTLCIWEMSMSTFANSEDPDEMQHNAVFHLGLH